MERSSVASDTGQPRLVLYNPLPRTLAHYADELASNLRTARRPFDVVEVRSEGLTGVAKVMALFAHLRTILALRRSNAQILVLWPLLGWLEPVLWASRRSRATIVVHDPVPLDRQVGGGRFFAGLARRMSRSFWPSLMCHSHAARDSVLAQFPQAPTVVLPHPLMEPTQPRATASVGARRVLVLGQYKAARNLELLQVLGRELGELGYECLVRGKGWPTIDGWQVEARFLSEDEFDAELRYADVVLIPYRQYFQSGVAIRALELGVPVVGAPTGFLVELVGTEYAGLVAKSEQPAAWIDAVMRALRTDTHSDIQAAHRRVAGAWAEWSGLQLVELSRG